MTEQGLLQIGLYLSVLLLLVIPLGSYLARIYLDERADLYYWLRRVEFGLYRLSDVDSNCELNWRQYSIAMLLFNLLGIAAVFSLQRMQAVLPLNPQGWPAVGADSAMNTAVSSAIGLDPHISVAAAEYQIHRVAKARRLSETQVRQLVQEHSEGRQWHLFGEARINVLKLNLALDALISKNSFK